MMKSSVQSSQQRYVGNAQNLFLFQLFFVRASSEVVDFFLLFHGLYVRNLEGSHCIKHDTVNSQPLQLVARSCSW